MTYCVFFTEERSAHETPKTEKQCIENLHNQDTH